MQNAVDQPKRLESNQREPHLLLIGGRARDQHRVNQFVEGRLLDEQQVLNDELLDDVELDLDRLRPQALLECGAEPRQADPERHATR